MKILLKIFLFVLLIVAVFGQSYTGSAAFLKRGMSARAIGLGSAYTAVVDDASATFWNPAGLLTNAPGFNLQISNLQDDIFNSSSFGDINSPQFALSHSFRKPILKRVYWAFGASVNGFFVKDIDRYDSDSNYINSFNYGEYAVFLSTAFKIRFIKLGFTWKFIEQNFGLVDHFTQNNKEIFSKKPHDIGIIFKPVNSISVGMVARDSIKIGIYDTYSKSKQLGIKFDLNAFKTSLPHLIIATDIIVIQRSLNKWNVGLEFEHQFKDNVSMSFRGGFSNMLFGMNNKNINEINQLNKKFALGLGMRYKNIVIDCAWVQEITQNPYSRFFVWGFSIKP